MQRRTFLSSIGTGTFSLAGCVDSPGSDDSDESTNQDQESISTNDLTFDVSIEEHFTETHPARIHVTLTNTLETQVILSTGATPPFTSYLSGSKSDENRLVLVPDVSEAENPLDWIGETNPMPTSAENGCWNVTQDVQIEEIGAEIKLEQGESSSQRYDIYGYQNDSCPSPGAYPFEDTLGAFRGQLSDDTTEHEVALGFTVTLDEDQSLSVENDDPAVTTAED